MSTWMKKLARHYQKMRKQYPEQELLILFDIDGTIVDMRQMIQYVLKSFDRVHETDFFEHLTPDRIEVHENQVDQLLDELNVPRPQRDKITDWYTKTRWSSAAILESHRPFRGVMEVIRWFQIQPLTTVGLNTGRPETMRADTLRSLNELGKEYRVQFSDELLFMNAQDWDTDVENSKVAGIKHFREERYLVIAMVDNEPQNLTAVADADTAGVILLLHADTIFETARSALPAGVAEGAAYDLTELISEKALPRHVQFVWHGLNDEANIRQFLASNIKWAEFDVRTDPDGNLVLRHDSFEKTALEEDEELLSIDNMLTRLDKFDKAIKLDLKQAAVIDQVIRIVGARGYAMERLWLNARVDGLGEGGFHKLAGAFPGAIVQCPIDFLAPLVATLPDHGRNLLDMLSGWGVNRFSVNWNLPKLTELLDRMDEWGFEVNIYNIPDLESFLRAVLLQPRSITSDFNFPEWHYYGRGSGGRTQRYEYELRRH